MRANKAKFEGMRLGATKRKAIDKGASRYIRWLTGEKKMIILGVPFG